MGIQAPRINEIIKNKLTQMRIAYLILAYKEYEHLERLIRALDDHEVMFFIHVDKKSKMPDNISEKKNIVFIDRINVWWGGWSLLQAVINLLSEAFLRNNFEYYILLSESDYPIRSREDFYNKLKEGGEFINIVKGFQSHKPEYRIRYYYFDGCNKRNKRSIKTLACFAMEEFQRRFKIIAKRRYPFKDIYHGSIWWALTGDCVEYLLKFIKENPKFVKFFKTSLLPDESFIHTIIGNSPYIHRCKNNLTYTDWSQNKSGPSNISMKHINMFLEHKCFRSVYGDYEPFFARKFSDQSKELISMIDNELRAITT